MDIVSAIAVVVAFTLCCASFAISIKQNWDVTAALRDELARERKTSEAYLNRLLAKHGDPIVFDEKGDIIANPVFQDTSGPVVMKPPIAAAESQWEDEYLEELTSNYALDLGISLSEMPEEEKDRLRAAYSINNQH